MYMPETLPLKLIAALFQTLLVETNPVSLQLQI